jgi:hypothetical protein
LTLAALRQILVRSRPWLVWTVNSFGASASSAAIGSLLGRLLASFLLSRQLGQPFGLHLYQFLFDTFRLPEFLAGWSSIVNGGVAVIVSQTAGAVGFEPVATIKRRLLADVAQALEAELFIGSSRHGVELFDGAVFAVVRCRSY